MKTPSRTGTVMYGRWKFLKLMPMEKMSEPAMKVLTAAGVDLMAVIKGAGEALIQNMKK